MQLVREMLDAAFSDVGVFDAVCVTFQLAFGATTISSVLGIFLGLCWSAPGLRANGW